MWVATRNFASAYRQLLRTTISTDRVRLVLAIFIGFLGTLTQIGLLGTIAVAAKYLNHDFNTGIPLIDDNLSGGTLTMVALFGLLMGFFFTFNALLIYAGGVTARKLGRRVNERTFEDAIKLASQIPVDTSVDSAQKGIMYSMALNRDPRILGVAIEIIVSLIQTFLFSVTYFAALFYLDWEATLYVCALILLGLPIFFALNQRVKSSSETFYQSGLRDFAMMTSKEVGHRNMLVLPYQDSASEDDAELMSSFKYSNDLYDTFLLSTDRNVLLASLLRAMGMVVVIIVLGKGAIDGNLEWSILIVYLFAMLRAAGQMTSLTSQTVSLVRFYSIVQHYYSILNWFVLDNKQQGDLPEEVGEYTTRSAESCDYLVECSTQLNRLFIPEILEAFGTASGIRLINYNEYALLGRSAQLPISMIDAKSIHWLDEMGFGGDIDDLLLDSESAWNKLTLEHRLLLLVRQCCLNGARAILISCHLRASASSKCLETLTELLEEHCCMSIWVTDGTTATCNQFTWVLLEQNGSLEKPVSGKKLGDRIIGDILEGSDDIEEDVLSSLY